jgi:energy-coupling factor transporter transmembrane protein EcfT
LFVAPGITPYSYRRGTSPLHRCPAALKLLGLFLVSLGAFSSIPGLAAAALFVTAGALAARIRPWELLRGSKTVFFLAASIIILRTLRFDTPDLTPGPGAPAAPSLSPEGFWGGLHQGLCFITSFAAGALLFSVTTMQELRDSLGRCEEAAVNRMLALPFFPSPKRRARSRFSLGLSLMLGFLPRFFELWETANLACDARACKKGLRRFMVLIPLIIERMMEMAGETAEALDSRGLSLNPASEKTT